MRFEKVDSAEEDEYSKLISCDFDNDTLLKKVSIKANETTFFYLNKNQLVLLMEKQTIHAIAQAEGTYKIDFKEKSTAAEKKELDKWKDYKDDKNNKLPLSLVFINLNEIIDCKFVINKPMEYVDYSDDGKAGTFIGNGLYNFQIISPFNFLSSTLGIRDVYTKQELIERIRKYIVASIEYDIQQSDVEYNIPIKVIKSKKDNILLNANSNQFDKKIEEYGVKITKFSIEQFQEYQTKREKKKSISKLTNKSKYTKSKNNDLRIFDFNHVKLGFDKQNELSINQLGLRCNLCNGELDSGLNYCLKCGTKINKNIY